jgi:hypothetical protein
MELRHRTVRWTSVGRPYDRFSLVILHAVVDVLEFAKGKDIRTLQEGRCAFSSKFCFSSNTIALTA